MTHAFILALIFAGCALAFWSGACDALAHWEESRHDLA